MKKIICFLTVHPCELFYNFCKRLKNDKYDIYIVIDDNKYNIPNYDNEINIIKIDDQICQNSGFKNTVLFFGKDRLKDRSCSRDKGLYYFCKNNIDYQYIWFIEEDVFIPSIHTIQNIDNKYIDGDLLVREHRIIYEKQTTWHWNHINNQIKIDPPYANSMICAIRCSKKLLECINDYAMKYKNLFMDEALFNTISLQNNLDVKTISELSTIEFRRKWKKHEIRVENLYHPIKCITSQYQYRL